MAALVAAYGVTAHVADFGIWRLEQKVAQAYYRWVEAFVRPLHVTVFGGGGWCAQRLFSAK